MNVKTTARIRQEIQGSDETLAQLARRLSLNPKTARYWKQAGRVTDKCSGPEHPRSTVLRPEEEQVICEFRRLTRLALDDVFVLPKGSITALTRSNLHRCLKRHGLNRLPPEDGEGQSVTKKKLNQYAIGYVHLDITEIRLGKQKRYLFVGIDRVCKYVSVELHERMTQAIAKEFLDHLIADCPFIIHTILTDNGAPFTYALLAEHVRPKGKVHLFDQTCTQRGIRHKPTKFRHPWTNGQVEVFNRTIKAHTVKRYHYDMVEQLKQHLMAFLLVYNFQRPLRALHYQSPYATMVGIYQQQPELFQLNPSQKIVGLSK